MSIEQKSIQMGTHTAEHFMLDNALGMTVELSSWGASLIDVQVPDRDGRCQSVTLAYEHWSDYEKNESYFGATIGRVAGRVAHGQLMLNGQAISVSQNQGRHHLHGGHQAISHQMWQVDEVVHDDAHIKVVFSICSPAGENGHVGNLNIRAIYVLSCTSNSLTVQYEATTDAFTVCNLTNHAYFNLSGNVSRTIHEHELTLPASNVCAMDDDLLVTGAVWPVAQTVFDFTHGKSVGTALSSDDARIKTARGLDHYFLLTQSNEHKRAAMLSDALSGRRLTVWTNQPCVVLYAHNHPNNEQLRHGVSGRQHDALCIEVQKSPHLKSARGDHPFALYSDELYVHTAQFIFDTWS